ncbi:MAG: BrnT family toxin [Acidobacteria bacterium]|nr:BrnT family toxin [Acidobacteriota bacterium]
MPLPNDLEFEWDEEKAAFNLKKHKITFEEAKTVFADPYTITIDDPKHSAEERRFIDIGTSAAGNILIVSYTERKKIRLISCRKASKTERKRYEEKEGY